jgi:sortase A
VRADTSRPGRLRAGIGVVGELMITLGVVLLLFVAYDLVWTGVETGRTQDRLATQLEQRWRAEGRSLPAGSAGAAPAVAPPAVARRGSALARLHVPRLGRDFRWVVVEGVRRDDLVRGPGHYPSSAGPGQKGNFAVAGHRATHGEPFRRLDRLRPGDAIVVETARTYYTYTVDRTVITSPDDVAVVLPVPHRPGAVPDRALLTLTTCHPRWSSQQRLVVSGHLSATDPVSAGPPPALRT